MIIKDQILKEVKKIENSGLLNQLFGYLHLMRAASKTAGNRDSVLHFAGRLSNAEAQRISKNINEIFNSVEGEWQVALL